MLSLLLEAEEAAERVERASAGAEAGGGRSGECWDEGDDLDSDVEST